jgi:hypothetical protein
MTGDISLLVAAGVLLVSAWALLVLYCWLTRSTQFFVHDPTLHDRITHYQPIRDDVCRCYMCSRHSAADRLTPRNS